MPLIYESGQEWPMSAAWRIYSVPGQPLASREVSIPDAHPVSVAMTDYEKVAPSPCKCGLRRRDYPQGKQRKEAGLAGKQGNPVHPDAMSPAGRTPGTPCYAGGSRKEKGLEDYSDPWRVDGNRTRGSAQEKRPTENGRPLYIWWRRRESHLHIKPMVALLNA